MQKHMEVTWKDPLAVLYLCSSGPAAGGVPRELDIHYGVEVEGGGCSGDGARVSIVGYDETRFFKHTAAGKRGPGREWQDAIDTGSVSSYSIMMTGGGGGGDADAAAVNVDDAFSYKVKHDFLVIAWAVALHYMSY